MSFVGSLQGAEAVYKKGTQHLKRVQAFAGAKNHMVVMPDANKKEVVRHLTGASCGAAGAEMYGYQCSCFCWTVS